MKKINIKLLKKYVNNDVLEGYSKEALEDDKDFMIAVFGYTNNPDFYDSCSDRLKKDYDFVKYLIWKFKSHSDFIIKVANNYLSNNNYEEDEIDEDEEVNEIEFNILMAKLLPEALAWPYSVKSETAYFLKRVEIEMSKVEDPEIESSIGLGFLLMFDSYDSSDIILNFYAEQMIKEIIKDSEIDCEVMVHNQFKTPDALKKVGICNYIINFLSGYDNTLSSYVSTHPSLMNSIKSIIEEAIKDWDRYVTYKEPYRYNMMLGIVHDYMNMADSEMEESEILYYVAAELGVRDKVAYYDNLGLAGTDLSLDYDYEFIDEMVRSSLKDNLKEQLVYLNVKKIMINRLFSSNPTDLYSIINPNGGEAKDDSKCKIIKLYFE